MILTRPAIGAAGRWQTSDSVQPPWPAGRRARARRDAAHRPCLICMRPSQILERGPVQPMLGWGIRPLEMGPANTFGPYDLPSVGPANTVESLPHSATLIAGAEIRKIRFCELGTCTRHTHMHFLLGLSTYITYITYMRCSDKWRCLMLD